MIERKDYILVQLDAIGLLITKLLGLKESHNVEQMRTAIDDAIRTTGLDLDTLDKSMEVEAVNTLILLQLQQALLVYLSVKEDTQMQRMEERISKHLHAENIYTYPM